MEWPGVGGRRIARGITFPSFPVSSTSLGVIAHRHHSPSPPLRRPPVDITDEVPVVCPQPSIP